MPNSPPGSTVYPDMSSTISTISHGQSPMQVCTPSFMPVPLDVGAELDALFDSFLDVQVDEESTEAPQSSRSSTLTLQGRRSPPGAPSVAGVPVFGSTTSVPRSASGAARTRLVIRLPPAIKGRKSIKPPVTPPTAEEMKTLVHVPLQRNSSDESSSATSPSTGSSSNTFSP